MKTAITVNRAFIDNCLLLHSEGRLDQYTASMAKLATTDLAWNICDEAVQLHGGAGFMWEYAVARNLADSRVPRIYGGSNEIMKEFRFKARSTRAWLLLALEGFSAKILCVLRQWQR